MLPSSERGRPTNIKSKEFLESFIVFYRSYPGFIEAAKAAKRPFSHKPVGPLPEEQWLAWQDFKEKPTALQNEHHADKQEGYCLKPLLFHR